MRSVINVILFLMFLGLVWVLISSIRDPIAFNAAKNKRQTAVVVKLEKIRKAQEMYRGITGEFAPDFDTLSDVLKNDSFMLVKIIGDPDDPDFTGEITYDTSYSPAIDSVRSLKLNVDSLRYVPFGQGVSFDIYADTITYQKTLVEVVEVGTKYAIFMGPYAKDSYSKYDSRYSVGNVVKFGDLNKPSLAGNWE